MVISAKQLEKYQPDDEKKVRRHLKKFEKFIHDRGGEILAPTSEWELVRFKTASSTGIIYRKANGAVTFFGGSKLAWECYLNDRSWTAGNKRKRSRGRQAIVIDSLIRRDGKACFYCGYDCDEETASVEHFVPLNAGGTDHMANKVLAHKSCNGQAGHLPVIEKVKLRERMRTERRKPPPPPPPPSPLKPHIVRSI